MNLGMMRILNGLGSGLLSTCLALLATALATLSANAAAPTPAQVEFFEKNIRPVLAAECYECHTSAKRKGSLVLDTREGLLKSMGQQPDLLLTDFRLRGGEDGISAVRSLRSAFPGLPALIVSGDTAPERPPFLPTDFLFGVAICISREGKITLRPGNHTITNTTEHRRLRPHLPSRQPLTLAPRPWFLWAASCDCCLKG